ncbi:hypothetical protein M378DRAFT_116137 [Amanita muscaria Koide BX008]|uniref:Inner centromere protein ARK-binding domain-containing protein n=1 Tax=Amanita muscaria (strain Koide BX008) TaxID=946122 RepID=A0A0C2X8X6_AMAMK|nr:hypothetical protein M378DRAFT_116137 [Amanita muscaria Koide BX008]
MATEGLLQWANSIRLTMATDPGRQLFKDQVQTHGFSFLDNYLDDILSNAKQDALIDLVKTPGRKRIMPQKIKPVLKRKDGVTLFPKDEEWNHPQDKKPLFGSSDTMQQEDLNKHEEVENVQATPNTVPSVPPTSANSGILVVNLLRVSHIEPNELSIIAEDDETAEKSRLSSPPRMDGFERETKTAQPVDTRISMPHGQPSQESTSCDHQDSTKAPLQPSVDQIRIAPDNEPRDTADDKCGNDLNKGPSPLMGCPTSSSEQGHAETDMQVVAEDPTPLPTDNNTEVVDILIPLRDIESPPASPNNHTYTCFPSLPAPVPPRKSLRAVADNNSTQVSLGTTTPGAAVTGKRTSWLQKARQAKALEIAGKKTTSLSSASLLQSSAPSLAAHAKRKSTEVLSGPSDDDNGRHRKVAKTADAEVFTSARAHSAEHTTKRLISPLPLETESGDTGRLDEEDVIGFLKKTVEGFGARAAGKKSLGVSAAASALAEARAAAEARIAERNMNKEEPVTMLHYGKPESSHTTTEGLGAAPAGQALISEHQPVQNTMNTEQDLPHLNSTVNVVKVFQPQPPFIAEEGGANRFDLRNATMTPPGTPPMDKNAFIPPPGPVFNKPPPVFKRPFKPQDEISKPSTIHARSSPAGPPLTAQSTVESIRSEVVFDNDGNTPAWMTGTQETSYTTVQMDSQDPNICDEDDSWPIDEKLSEGVQWICANAKDDSTTWSSVASQHNISEELPQLRNRTEGDAEHIDDLDAYETDMERSDTNLQNASESDPDDDIHETAKNNIRLVDPPRSQSQLSHSSSASSQQSQVGFFGQASKLITSMMGSGKKPKPDVKKVMQKAAFAAKKQQEETDRKAARLKEMENRRQLALQRKAEEDKAKMEEQEKKIKEENERRKREREEHTDKRPLKAAPSRKDEEVSKKRKIEVEKKAEIKNPSKPIVKSALKQPSALSSSAAYNSSFNVTTAPTLGAKLEVKPNKATTPLTALSKGKGKAPANALAIEDDTPQPSQIVQTQMAARAKAQLQAAKLTNEPPLIPSESIELPDINSEYSDSEDEDRQRTFDPPDWAQSPELREALQQQSTINPDDIFGTIRPLRMEELFKKRTSRFRARTSSANWAGADRLTVEEEREYARRMGFK